MNTLANWKKFLLVAVMICFLVPIMTKADIAEADAKSDLIISEAKKLLGYKYRYGGETPKEGFDSSGLIQYAFGQADIHLPRSVNDQSKVGMAVKPADLKPGDILFFKKAGSSGTAPTHAALYIGDGQMIHSTLSKGVIVTNYKKSSYWSGSYIGAKRVAADPETADVAVVQEAEKYLGIPYVFGGSTPSEGFDCSGLVQYVFKQALDIYLPRSAEQQWAVGEKVALQNMKPGDVIYFSNTYKTGISHAGIYAGGGRFIQASRSEKVTISYLSEDYWKSKMTGIRRFNNLMIPKENPIVSEATLYIGEVPYKKSGVSPETGFDTSGFIQYVYQKAAGISLPRYATSQYKAGTKVDKADLKPGDIVFFQSTSLNPAIYIGNGQVVHVTLTNGVTITNMNTSTYWKDKYAGSIRVQ
ncbi:C40 family peptidase [Bacillus halotolerans]|uniref:C40 family peptidase n=1 Tax=Bacillus halotolerans TaxID=260554 RepID=A0ABY7I0I4_9BACI|nr:C40 family peptidase [Bacillus halotolerans]MDG0764719.1 C40 family peptidase [Bacillus halotolerans]UUI83912.1 C40 family peptidase [Bacillus halotolerans]WAT20941.1 C40 family peptidase [Bacillus halotolerans]